VIIVSSKDQETDKVWGERQGAQGYVTKPVEQDELIEIIRRVIS
jgi:twitching motility two-component system response regulator PilH